MKRLTLILLIVAMLSSCATLPYGAVLLDDHQQPVPWATICVSQQTRNTFPLAHSSDGPQREMLVKTDSEGHYFVPIWIHWWPFEAPGGRASVELIYAQQYVYEPQSRVVRKAATPSEYFEFLLSSLAGAGYGCGGEDGSRIALSQIMAEEVERLAKSPKERMLAIEAIRRAGLRETFAVANTESEALELLLTAWRESYGPEAKLTEISKSKLGWSATGPTPPGKSSCNDYSIHYSLDTNSISETIGLGARHGTPPLQPAVSRKWFDKLTPEQKYDFMHPKPKPCPPSPRDG